MKLGKNDKITFDLYQDAFKKLKLARDWEKKRGVLDFHRRLDMIIKELEDSGYLDPEFYVDEGEDESDYEYWSAKDDKEYDFEEFLKNYKENS